MTIEKKINKGELFQFPKTMAKGGAGVHNIGCLDIEIGDSAKEGMFSKAERQSSLGSHATKSGRNFIWLPWMEGAVNYADQQGKDVMSGPFSGCYMIRYRQGGGDWRVAHVHTPGAIDDWNAMAAGGGFEIGCGFKPYLRRNTEDDHDKTYGIITSTGSCYRIWAGKAEYGFVDKTVAMRRIKEVKLITNTPSPASLKTLVPMDT